MTSEESPKPGPWFRSRSGWVLIAFLVIAGFFVLSEHRAHVLGVLPWLLILACPLLHFLHGGHGGSHRGHGGTRPRDREDR